MTKVLQLAQSKFTPEKLGEKVFVSEKLDGVPVRITIKHMGAGVLLPTVQSRQSKPVPSVKFVVRDLLKVLATSPLSMEPAGRTLEIVGEVTHEDYTDFKDVSGVVRRQEPQSGLVLNIFDFWDSDKPEWPFRMRIAVANHLFNCSARYMSPKVRCIPQYAIMRDQIEDTFKQILPVGAEGGIVRDAEEQWKPGKRTWGYQKYIKDPSIDLWIVGCEEAISQHGEPLGMAGRLIASYQGREIGVGPGKLTHKERTEVFAFFGKGRVHRRMACIKHKHDPSYDDLRQPTFQHWRDDKDEADA